MCGIAAFFDFTKKSGLDTLKAITDTVTHRGPDSSGYELIETAEANVGLGHRRLSIIDLSEAGHQPMFNKAGDVCIIFNGEIYNYKELKTELESKGLSFRSNSDTEVILEAYSIYGIECIHKFIGMFAFILYDRQKNKVFIVRDRAGVKPLYYSFQNSVFIAGSELKVLMAHPAFVKKQNHNSVFSFINYGYIPASNTIFQNAHKLQAGHYIELNLLTKQHTEHCYWDAVEFYKTGTLQISLPEAEEQLESLLLGASKYRMVADVPVGVFLSGGYDSSLITAMLQKQFGNIRTFSIGFEEAGYNEAADAKKVAAYLGTIHTEKYCSKKEAQDIIPTLSYYYDEPFGDASAIPTILVSKLAKEYVKVSLSSDAGDELFGGYNKYSNALLSQQFKRKVPVFAQKIAGIAFANLPVSVISKVRKKYTPKDLINKFSKALTENLDAFGVMHLISKSYGDEKSLKKLFGPPVDFASSNFNSINELKGYGDITRMLAVDYKTYLVDDILTKVDRATMSVSLEGREPLLDHRLLEFAAKLPDEYKIKGLSKKVILKNITHKYLPKQIMDRPKMGFGVPVAEWMREDLRDLFDEYISTARLKNAGIFNDKNILDWKHKYYAGDTSYFTTLWYIFNYMMWHERWS